MPVGSWGSPVGNGRDKIVSFIIFQQDGTERGSSQEDVAPCTWDALLGLPIYATHMCTSSIHTYTACVECIQHIEMYRSRHLYIHTT